MLGLAAVPSAGLLLGALLLPESPRWLVMQARSVDARQALTFLHGSTCEQELKGIQDSCLEQEKVTLKRYYHFQGWIFTTTPQ
jgi:hypothetical protein